VHDCAMLFMARAVSQVVHISCDPHCSAHKPSVNNTSADNKYLMKKREKY